MRATLSRLDLQPGERLLDVGCGTGALLHRLRGQHSAALLAGVDPVPAMLEGARRRLPAELSLQQAWAERLPFPDAEFDVVVSCNMFHYVRHPREALAEMRRVLRPEGRLVLTDWCDDYWACWICDLYLRWFDRAHFRTYGSRTCVQLLEEADLFRVRLDRYKISWLWGLMTAVGQRPGNA